MARLGEEEQAVVLGGATNVHAQQQKCTPQKEAGASPQSPLKPFTMRPLSYPSLAIMDVPRRPRPRDDGQRHVPPARRPNQGAQPQPPEGREGQGRAVRGRPRAAGVPAIPALLGGVRGLPEGWSRGRAGVPAGPAQAQQGHPGVLLPLLLLLIIFRGFL